MNATELKKMAEDHCKDIDKRISSIELKIKTKNSWHILERYITANVNLSDEQILKKMTEQFGAGILKELVLDNWEKYVNEIDKKIEALQNDLKMKINFPK